MDNQHVLSSEIEQRHTQAQLGLQISGRDHNEQEAILVADLRQLNDLHYSITFRTLSKRENKDQER